MNVSTDIRPETAARQTRSPNADALPDHSFAPASPDSSPSRWDTTDTVTISDEARAKGRIAEPAITGEPDFTAEELAPLKARFRKLLESERGIDGRIGSILDKKSIKLGPQDQVKIEIDKSGKAIVGGISDVKAARALEKAINSDKKLLNDLKAYQKEEKSLSGDMLGVTGKSLKEYAGQVKETQRNGVPLPGITVGGEEWNPLIDPGLNAVDSEFAGMIADHYGMKSPLLDYSGENNILENAEGTVNSMMMKVTGDIGQAFGDMNKAIRMGGGDAEEIENSLVDLSRLKISVDNNGEVVIEGTASKDNKETDRAAKKIIKEMFEKELNANPATGEQHDFTIAASYLLNVYDESFGEDNPLGLGADDRTLEATYDHGKIESHVSSPEREAELTAEIDKAAKDALEDMNIDAKGLAIEMNDEGKLAATNLNPDDPKAQSIRSALDVLNSQLENRTIKDAHKPENELAMDPVKRLRGLMTNMDVLRPGGASLLKRTASKEEEE